MVLLGDNVKYINFKSKFWKYSISNKVIAKLDTFTCCNIVNLSADFIIFRYFSISFSKRITSRLFARRK